MSQNEAILQFLKGGGELTALDALYKFGTMKLATRCSDLRKQGVNIRDEYVESNGKRFKKYWMG
jgi:hypothetical protein